VTTPVFALLDQLRMQVEEIASSVGAAALPRGPIRVDDRAIDGPLRIWHEERRTRVHTVPTADGGGVVYLSEGRFDWDWVALGPQEARALGTALLAAAAEAAAFEAEP